MMERAYFSNGAEWTIEEDTALRRARCCEWSKKDLYEEMSLCWAEVFGVSRTPKALEVRLSALRTGTAWYAH